MPEPIQEKIMCSLHAAEGLYHRLVLLVGETGSGKTAVLREVADELGAPVINVNLELSARLLEMTAKQRVLRLSGLLGQIVETGHPAVVLDNLEILFDTNLGQDPLRLLQGISRNQCVIASWNGSARSGKLTYAEPGHQEYRHYDLLEILMVGMDGTATVDTGNETREAGTA